MSGRVARILAALRTAGPAVGTVTRSPSPDGDAAVCGAGCGVPVDLSRPHYTVVRAVEWEKAGQIDPIDGDPLASVHINCWPTGSTAITPGGEPQRLWAPNARVAIEVELGNTATATVSAARAVMPPTFVGRVDNAYALIDQALHTELYAEWTDRPTDRQVDSHLKALGLLQEAQACLDHARHVTDEDDQS